MALGLWSLRNRLRYGRLAYEDTWTFNLLAAESDSDGDRGNPGAMPGARSPFH